MLDNKLVSLLLCFNLIPVYNLLAKQNQEDNDWSMIMEVEVEDPVYNSTSDSSEIMHRKEKNDKSIMNLLTNQSVTICGSHLCYNLGRCYTDWHTSYSQCLCPLGFSGDLCEKEDDGHEFPYIQQNGYLKFRFRSLVTYSNESHERYKISTNYSFTYKVNFEIRPNVTGGKYLLVSHVSKNGDVQFSVSIENGYVVYRSLTITRTNSEPYRKEEIQEVKHFSFLNKDQWYYISFGVSDDRKSFLSVDGIKEDAVYMKVIPWSNVNYYEKYFKNVDDAGFSHIYFGGHPALIETEGPVNFLGNSFEYSYSGCIQNIRINGVYMDPRRKAFFGDAVDGYGISNCGSGLCEKQQCKNNASCLQTSGSTVICQCLLGTAGQQCEERIEVIMPFYNGYSYTEYVGLSGTSSSFTTLQLHFRPIKPDGLLLYEGYSQDKRGDFLSVILFHGHLLVAFDLGSGSAFLKSPKPIKMNEWHRIHFWRIGREGYLQIDSDEHIMTNYSFGSQVQLTLTYSLFLGGHPNMNIISTHLKPFIGYSTNMSFGFQGCIESVETNGVIINPIDDSINGVNILNCDGEACARSNSVCLNKGRCLQTSHGFTCVCPLGFQGTHCKEKINWQGKQLATFRGNSFVEFTASSLNYRPKSHHYHLSFEFKLANNSFEGDINSAESYSQVYNKSSNFIKRYLVYAVFENAYRTQNVLIQLLPINRFELKVENTEFNTMKMSSSNLTNQSINKEEMWKSTHNQFSRRLWIQKYDISEEIMTANFWHKILLTRSTTGFTLFINQSLIARVHLVENDIYEMFPVRLYVGGIPEMLHAQRRYLELMSNEYSSQYKQNIFMRSKNFNGYINKLEINGFPTSFSNAQNGQDITQWR
ncbi:unnamed protein product [Trichobilharzia szidati]|nr:unnamed protein product [Trichobilharzia szidati]